MQEALSPQEIQARVKRNYLERLATRVRKLRQVSKARDWQELRILCEQLNDNAQDFGFPEIAAQAQSVLTALPFKSTSPASRNLRRVALDIPCARAAVDQLTSKIDEILTLHQIPRAN